MTELAVAPVQTQSSELDSLVMTALQNSPHMLSRRLRCESQDGRVVLRGTVRSYYQKQLAQETLRRVAGVASIDNQIEVHGS